MTNVATPQSGGHVRRVLDLLFGWIEEPRVIRVLCFAAYLALVYGAYVALIDPPRTIEGAAGPFLMVVIGITWAIGSATTLVAVLPGWWGFERAGLIALIVGYLAYDFIIISLSFSETDLNRGLQLVTNLVATIALIARFVAIRGSDLDPKV